MPALYSSGPKSGKDNPKTEISFGFCTCLHFIIRELGWWKEQVDSGEKTGDKLLNQRLSFFSCIGVHYI